MLQASTLEVITKSNDLFFATLTVVEWIDVFTRIEYAEFLLNQLIFCQKHKGLEIYEYDLMPSHLHLIAACNVNSLSNILRDF